MQIKINGMIFDVDIDKCEVTEIKHAIQYLINEPVATSVTTVRGIVVERV